MVEISHKYRDDLQAALPPERYPGSMGFASTEVLITNIRGSVYRFILDFGHPAFFQPGNEQMYLIMRDHPVKIDIGEQEYTNPLDMAVKIGKDF